MLFTYATRAQCSPRALVRDALLISSNTSLIHKLYEAQLNQDTFYFLGYDETPNITRYATNLRLFWQVDRRSGTCNDNWHRTTADDAGHRHTEHALYQPSVSIYCSPPSHPSVLTSAAHTSSFPPHLPYTIISLTNSLLPRSDTINKLTSNISENATWHPKFSRKKLYTHRSIVTFRPDKE